MTLKEYCDKHYARVTDFLKDWSKFGVSQRTLQFWLAGKTTPIPAMVRKIELKTKGLVTDKDWPNRSKKS